MYPLAVFVIAFILGMVFAREIRVALVIAVVFTLLTVGFLAWNSESDEREDKASRGTTRGMVPQSLVGVWEGGFERDSAQREKRVRLTVMPGITGAGVAIIRITRLRSECVERATLTKAYDNRIVVKPTKMPGTKTSCGSSYQLTVDGDRATFEGTGRSQATVSRSQSRPAPSISAVIGQWRGTYVCGQGETGLTLTISFAGFNKVNAVFAFYPVRGNPDVATGTSVKVGVYTDGHLTLQHDRWIKRPDGYGAVDLSADIAAASPRTMTGKILSSSCKTLTLTKQG